MPRPKRGEGKRPASKAKEEVTKTKRKYSGELAKPLEPLKIGLLMDETEKDFLLRQRDLLEANKLLLLLDEYRIRPGPQQWLHLALALARENVPGFKEAAPRGRPTKWHDITLWMLSGEMCREMLAGARSHAEAARRLAKQARWAEFLADGKWRNKRLGTSSATEADCLLEQYNKMPDGYRVMGEHAFRWNEHSGTLDKWNELVTDVLANPPTNSRASKNKSKSFFSKIQG